MGCTNGCHNSKGFIRLALFQNKHAKKDLEAFLFLLIPE